MTTDSNPEIDSLEAQQENKLQTWTKPGFEQMGLKEAMTSLPGPNGDDVGFYS